MCLSEACIAVCCEKLCNNGKIGRTEASCDHRMLSPDRITNEEVRRRCGMENLEHRLRKMRLRWFGHVRRRDENSLYT